MATPPPASPSPMGAGCVCTSVETTCMSGGVNVGGACGCQDSDNGNPWCFVVDPSTCIEAEQACGRHATPVPEPVPALNHLCFVSAGAVPVRLVLARRCREALRPVQLATAHTAAPLHPTAPPCDAPVTAGSPTSTETTIFAASPTITPFTFGAPIRPAESTSHPSTPTGPTLDGI